MLDSVCLLLFLLCADSPRFFIGTSGLDCGSGNRLVTFEEAKRFQSTVCSLPDDLGDQDTVNLASGSFDGRSNDNVLKPVPEPPSGTRTRPVEGLWNRKMDAVLIGGPGHVDAKH